MSQILAESETPTHLNTHSLFFDCCFLPSSFICPAFLQEQQSFLECFHREIITLVEGLSTSNCFSYFH